MSSVTGYEGFQAAIERQEASKRSYRGYRARTSALLNLDFIKRCLSGCEGKHATCSQWESQDADHSPSDIFLVNVQEECLEPANASLRYFALSYVWGDERFCKTRGKDVLTHQRPGSLPSAGTLFKVPRTIRDAITLTKRLGEKYVWGDALCIIQDNAVHRTQQLKIKDKIYRRAAMTIVAMSGDDAWSGLSGVVPNSRKPIMPVENIEGEMYSLTIEPPRIKQVVDLCTWNKRAWTFQKQMLSTRCLYLSDWQAYFQCERTTVSESDIPDAGCPPTWMPMQDLNPLFETWISGRPRTWDEGYRCYKGLVGRYLDKKMTYKSDILNAFEGVAAVMQGGFGSNFLAGLPEAIIDLCLLWAPVVDIERRLPPGFCFPSWSWAGWKGRQDQTWRISFFGETLGIRLGHVTEDYLPYQPEILRSEIEAILVEVNGAFMDVARRRTSLQHEDQAGISIYVDYP
ncbi:hypothetical protein DL770_009893 [Monosporascus sp. CRB-9-2]|nr:hypothetical protein DL770_009893 [Monosporascus sp. CRB-9-2]